MSPSQSRAKRFRSRAVLAIALLMLACAFPAVVAGHVNRQVGPYTFLVVLVEEPTFEDNHAGFKFWVRRDEVPILGLESSVQAVAAGHGQRVALAVPPVDQVGFYDLDHSTDGAAFDPLGGGSWTLELTGSVEGTPIDVTFPVSFPSYPRVAAPNAAPATTPVDAGGVATLPIVLVLGGGAGILAAAAALGVRARRGLRPG